MPDNALVGLFLIGMAVGLYIPQFPEPLGFLNTYLGLILVIIAIILLAKK